MVDDQKYDPPAIGTVFPLRSKFARDSRSVFVERLGYILGSNNIIGKNSIPKRYDRILRIRLDEHLGKFPVRNHEKHWIDGGKQIAIFHPNTSIPFYFNYFASSICRLCNGDYTIEKIIAWSKKEWPSISEQILIKDIMKFLLLLEELDLIKLVG